MYMNFIADICLTYQHQTMNFIMLIKWNQRLKKNILTDFLNSEPIDSLIVNEF